MPVLGKRNRWYSSLIVAIGMLTTTIAWSQQPTLGRLTIEGAEFTDGTTASNIRVHAYFRDGPFNYDFIPIDLDANGDGSALMPLDQIIPAFVTGPDEGFPTVWTYPDQVCVSDIETCLASAASIDFSQAQNIVLDDVFVTPETTLTLQVEISDGPLPGSLNPQAAPEIYDADFLQISSYGMDWLAPDKLRIRGLAPGQYFVLYRGILHPEIDCIDLGLDCMLSMGSTISIVPGEQQTIDWPLPGIVDDFWYVYPEIKQIPYEGVGFSRFYAVSVENGEILTQDGIDFGHEEALLLPKEDIYLFAVTELLEITAFPDVPCASLNVNSCETTPTILQQGSHQGMTVSIDAKIQQGIRIEIPETDPELKIAVDIWDKTTENIIHSELLTAGESRDVAIHFGRYKISTEIFASSSALLDSVYPGIACPSGPARALACDMSQGEYIEVNPDNAIVPVSVPLVPSQPTSESSNIVLDSGLLYGRIIGENLGKLNFQEVELLDHNLQVFASTRTDKLGRYEFYIDESGDYALYFRSMFSSGAICDRRYFYTVISGCDFYDLDLFQFDEAGISKMDFVVPDTVPTMGSITGYVYPTNTNLTVEYRNLDTHAFYSGGVNRTYNIGGYGYGYLPTGDYRVKFIDEQGNTEYYRSASACQHNCPNSAPAIVSVTDNSRVELEKFNFSGQSAVLGGGLPSASLHPQTLDVCAIPAGEQRCAYFADLGGSSGYRFYDIPDGDYHLVWFRDRAQPIVYPNMECNDLNYSACISGDTPTVNVSAAMPDLNAHMAGATTGQLHVAVEDTEGQPIVDNLQYVLFTHDRRFVRRGTAVGDTFLIGGLPDGEYYLIVGSTNPGVGLYPSTLYPASICPVEKGYLDIYEPLCDVQSLGQSITVDNANPIAVTVTIATNTRLFGQLVDDRGEGFPISEGTVTTYLYDDFSGTFKELETVDVSETGAFSLYVPSTIVKVKIAPEQGNLVRWLGNTENCYENYEVDCNLSDAPYLQLTGNTVDIDLGALEFAGMTTISFYHDAPYPGSGWVLSYPAVATESTSDAIAIQEQPQKDINLDIDGEFTFLGSYDIRAGNYALLYYPIGNYYLREWLNGEPCLGPCEYGPENVISLQPRENIDLYFSPVPSQKFSANFFSTEEPERGVVYSEIEIVDENGNPVTKRFGSQTGSATGATVLPHSGEPYRVKISAQGYYPQIYPDIDCANTPNCDISQGALITPQAGVTVSQDFYFTPQNRISGTVVDETGAPLSDVEVEIFSINAEYSFPRTVLSTDENGEFSISGVPYAHYSATAQKPGYYLSKPGNMVCYPLFDCDDQEILFEITPQTTNEIVSIIMQPRAKLRIHNIVSTTGSQFNLADFDIQIFDASQSRPTRRWSASYIDEGALEILLPVGEVFVGVSQDWFNTVDMYQGTQCDSADIACWSQSQPFSVQAGDLIDIETFEIERPVPLTFQLTDSMFGEPAEGIDVRLYSQSGASLGYIGSSDQKGIVSAEVYTGRNYRVVFDGEGTSRKFPDSLLGNQMCLQGIEIDCRLLDSDLLVVPEGIDQLDQHISLDLAPHFSITALDSNSLADLNPDPDFFNENGARVGSNIHYVGGETRFFPPHSASYYVLVGSGDSYWINAYPDQNCSGNSLTQCDHGYQLITLDSTNLYPELFFELDLKKGITGFVYDRVTGEPVADIELDLWSDAGATPFYMDTTETALNGGFSFPEQFGWSRRHLLSTVMPVGSPYLNALYRDVICYDGPAILGLCDLTNATSIYRSTGFIELNILVDKDLLFSADQEPLPLSFFW